MNGKLPPSVVPLRVLAAPICLLLFAGCAGTPSGRGGYRASREVEVQPAMVFEDDYDYYPAYEVYYSRNRGEYVYFDRNRWIRSSEPRIVSRHVLVATPSVRMDFRDSPERHHNSVVRSYPRDWHHDDARPASERNDNRDSDSRSDRR